MPTLSTRAPRVDDAFEFLDGVEVETDRNAETIAQGIGQETRARGGADEGEFRQLDLD
ncbi:hypothetical protein ABIF95_004020 [Bradyrhizobium ottawaense]